MTNQGTFTVTTDQLDYPPGSTARISATGLAAGATAEFQVQHVIGVGTDGIWGTLDDTVGDNSGLGHLPWQVVDGGAGDLDGLANGAILTEWYVNPDDSLGASFRLTGRTGGADGQLGTADDAVATMSFTDSPVAITTTGVNVTLDESALLQNSFTSPSVDGDKDDNDIAVASLPTAFATRLATLTAATTETETMDHAALSGYTGEAGNTGSNAFTISGTGAISDVRFVDEGG